MPSTDDNVPFPVKLGYLSSLLSQIPEIYRQNGYRPVYEEIRLQIDEAYQDFLEFQRQKLRTIQTQINRTQQKIEWLSHINTQLLTGKF